MYTYIWVCGLTDILNLEQLQLYYTVSVTAEE